MKMGIRSIALVVIALAAIAPARAQEGHSTWDLLVETAQARGIDADLLGAQTLTVRLGDDTQTRTIRGWVEQFDPAAQVGPPAPANVNAGDLLHAYLNFCAPCSTAKAYQVTSSAIVPATPAVTPPAGPFFDVGGSLRQIKAAEYIVGLHSTGSAVGGNVDTTPGSPGPAPLWLPVINGGVVADESLDFAGHAVIGESETCFFGICFAVGGFLGDGVTLFDNTSGASLPTIP